jgi:signal transduction histidine kinase
MDQSLSVLVIHDIKNSLALLEADLEQLNHKPDMPEEAHKAYQRCIELKNRLISFLTLYKHEQGRLKPNLAEIELSEFLEDMIASSQSVAMSGKHGRAVEVSVAEDRIKIAPGVKHKGVATLDEYLLDLALESALNNALRYAASKVDIWFEQDAESVTFFVQDDGPGLNSAETQADKPSSTGLGMSLCNAVTAAHGGGTVSLGNAVGGGALFTMGFRLVG